MRLEDYDAYALPIHIVGAKKLFPKYMTFTIMKNKWSIREQSRLSKIRVHCLILSFR